MQEAGELFQVVGIRIDGSRRILVSGISKAIAEKTLAGLSSDVFAQTIIEPDVMTKRPRPAKPT
jgi:hypothetical protein